MRLSRDQKMTECRREPYTARDRPSMTIGNHFRTRESIAICLLCVIVA
ncbi:hypothetical protein V3C99_019230 [Haemonchus contortus]|uniref:Uncharacterized protein n=1 Tax=Haemonchus contortus TaxID=6289 RepID=A0A7I4YZT7_HAECO